MQYTQLTLKKTETEIADTGVPGIIYTQVLSKIIETKE